ncbi:MAG: nucleotidyltransferase family protein [Pikeienuella sp.]
MVLAAGFGTRMGELTKDRPKPLIKVAGRALIDHSLDHCDAAGIQRAVVNLHYRGEQLMDHLSNRHSLKIEFSEETEILETGGGVVKALPQLNRQTFYTINSDAIWTGGSPLQTLQSTWEPEKMSALLLLVPTKRALGYTRAGDFFLDQDNRVRRRGEADSATYVFTGAQIITAQSFDAAPAGAFSLNVIWNQILAAGRLYGVVHDGDWVDVGSPVGLEAAERALKR